MMMQKELMPLIIPSGSPVRNVVSEHGTVRPDGKDETPPRVPPKSPGTESRASPRPKKTAHSASSSTSTLHSTSSSATSLSNVSGKCSPQSCHSVHQAGSRAGSPLLHQNSLTSGEGRSSSSLLKHPDRFGKRTPPRAESPHAITGVFVRQDGVGKQKPPLIRSLSNDPKLLNSKEHHAPLISRPILDRAGSSWMDLKREEPVKEIFFGHAASSKPLWHQRGHSETSTLNYVRSTTKADVSAVQRLDRTALKGPTLSEEKTALPTGFRVREVSGKLSGKDLKELKEKADEQIMTFEVLLVKDVLNLSRVRAWLGGSRAGLTDSGAEPAERTMRISSSDPLIPAPGP